MSHFLMNRLLASAVLVALPTSFALGTMAEAAETNANTVETVVVTANKREQSIQSVPESIVAITGEDLSRKDIKDLSDYLLDVPGITYDQSQGPGGNYGRQTVGIRGVQRFAYITDNTVGFYIDDTPVDVNNPRLYDLNRIEVLRGPQGTLYGSGSVGGTIKLITNQPSTEGISGSAKLDGDAVNNGGLGWEADAALNLPIGDKVALRAVGVFQRVAGYIDNYNNANTKIGSDINSGTILDLRASLLIQPTERLKITPSIYYDKSDYNAAINFDSGAGIPALSTRQYTPTNTNNRFMLAGLNINYDFGWADFVSQTSYYDYRSNNNGDLTLTFMGTLSYYNSLAIYYAGLYGLTPPPTPVPWSAFSQYYQSNEKTFVEEARLVSHLDGPFSYVVGVFFQDAQRPFNSSIIVPNFNTTYGPYLGLLAGSFVFPSSPAGDVYSITHSTRDQTQVAVFGEASYDLNKKLSVTGGLRYFDYNSKSTDAFTGFAFNGVPALAPGSASASGVNPKITANYKFSDDDMVYATASRGFRPGGSNIPLPSNCNPSLTAAGITPPAPSQYKPDSVWNYEAGIKTSWANGKIVANAAVYQMDWSDVQLPVPLSSCKIQGYVTNAGGAQSKGGEFQLSTTPFHDLNVDFQAAYVDSYLTSNSVVLSASKGTPLLYVPKWTWTTSAQYGFNVIGHSSYLRADVSFHASTPLDYARVLKSDPYTQLDLRWAMTGEMTGATSKVPWEAAIYVRNATDVNPFLSKAPLGYGVGTEVSSLTPRTIGVSFNINF